MNIFAEHAPRYWAAGLPVIPLRPWNSGGKSPGKAPIPGGWQQYCSAMPPEAVREHWVGVYADSNIGLPFGSASGLCAIDIDTVDERLVEAIESVLPASPWRRVGKKGCGLIFRWQGQRNFKIRDADNQSIVEFLGNGNQMVVPPSIHPDTGTEYVASADLCAVLTKIQLAPLDLEDRLRSALEAAGVRLGGRGRSAPLDVIPSGERDTQMTRHAGYLARVVLGIDKKMSFTLQEAIDHMFTWVEDFVVKVPGDVMDPAKGVAKLLEFLLRDIEGGRTLPRGWADGLRPEWDGHSSIEAMKLKNERQSWSVSRAVEWLTAKIALNPQDDDYILTLVKEIIELVAADDQFGDPEMRALVARILPKIAGIGLKKGDLMIMFKAARKGESGEDAWEDQEMLARAVIAEIEKGGELRFAYGRFYQWSGARWAELDRGAVYLEAASVKGSILMRRNSDYEAVVKVCERLVPQGLAGEEERGVNFANGWVGMDGKLVDHDPKFGATFTLPFDYRPGEARCPRFFDFLTHCWGREEDFADRVKLFQEAAAASLFGLLPNYQAAVLLHGRPSTGKTVLLSIFRALLPPEAISDVGPTRWGERFALSGLVGKVLNVCGELPENAYIPGHIFKMIVEGSPMDVEFKNQNSFSFTPVAGHWFASNYLPLSKDSSEGFVRRWLILGFDRVVTDEEKIPGLAQSIIAEEREGIAAWVIAGLQDLLSRGRLPQPASHLKLIGELRRVNNSVLAWLESSPDVRKTGNPHDEIDGMMAYDRYSFHAKMTLRGSPVPYERFIQMLYDMGCGRVMMPDGKYRLTGVRSV